MVKEQTHFLDHIDESKMSVADKLAYVQSVSGVNFAKIAKECGNEDGHQAMKKIRTYKPHEMILLSLLEDRGAVRTPSGMWRWLHRWDSAPSLANKHVSVLFRADYVTEERGFLKLTAMGRIVAKRVPLTRERGT